MAAKQRRSSKQVQARDAARKKAARFREQEDERLRIAEEAIVLQEEIADFDEETERRVAKLREDRGGQLVEKREKLDALVVEMLDTEVPAQEASERLGMSVGQVRAAKKNFDQAVAALEEDAAPGSAPASAVLTDGEEGQVSSDTDTSSASQAAEAPEAYSFPPPGERVVVPAQEGSPEGVEGATLPPGSAG